MGYEVKGLLVFRKAAQWRRLSTTVPSDLRFSHALPKETHLRWNRYPNQTIRKHVVGIHSAVGKSNLRLRGPPTTETIYRILNESPQVPALTCRPLKKFRNMRGENNEVEWKILGWVKHCFERHVDIDSWKIKAKYRIFQSTLNGLVPRKECTNLKFSEGWLNAFKLRWVSVILALTARVVIVMTPPSQDR